MTNMERTGNMPTSLRPRNSVTNSKAVEVSGVEFIGHRRRVLRHGGDGEFSDFFESLFGSRRGGGRSAAFRGQDYNAELHLSFHDAAQTHKQVLSVNGKNIRISVPAG